MNKLKSLSDSSTSESEDDHGKRIQQNKSLQFQSWGNNKRKLSTDTEEEQNYTKDPFFMMSQTSFKSPQKLAERTFSTDDTEDENHEYESSSKKLKGDFKSPTKYAERSLSGSESDDKNSFERGFSLQETEEVPELESYAVVASKMMQKMGYKKGSGLGKFGQGRVEIIEASQQRGRRGLGLIVEGFEPSDTKWDSSIEQVFVQEPISWIPECEDEPLNIKQLRDWMKEGEKKMVIDDETEFCNPDILKNVLNYKSVFDKLEAEDMRKARTRSNPFETIRGGIFLNRAAMKMANMDSAFDMMFTNPVDENGESLIGNKKLLYFADVCAGPGGFSEYVLWRKKWEAKGFGFTLKGPNDFKLEDFFAGPPETFETHYGYDGDGNIFSSKNLEEFKKYVKESTDNKGVHFVMADGGFSVEGRENLQEILSKRLYLCQFFCALLILRPKGHFVCKLFDIYTPFSVGLIYLMYHAFEKVCIFKPNTSRPANSERYIICKWMKDDSKDICDYMYEINCELDNYGATSDKDIVEVVPLDVLKESGPFYDYIVQSNESLGERQIIHLDKIRVFEKNVKLHEERQSDLRKQCLALWKVPDQARAAPSRPDPGAKFKELMQGETSDYHSSTAEPLTDQALKKLESLLDYHCVVCGESKMEYPPGLFIGVGRSNVYRYDTKNAKWCKLDGITLEIPADTLFYGELIQEMKGEGRGQRKILSLHIIDVLYLGGMDMRKSHFEDRMAYAEKLSKAVSKPNKSEYTPLRVKEVYQLKNIKDILSRLSMKHTKGAQVRRLCFDLLDGRHILLTGLMIFRTTLEPWVTAFSKTNQRNYLFNTKNKRSSFERVPEAYASFKDCFLKRIMWKWERGVKLIKEQEIALNESAIHGQTMLNFINEHFYRITGQVLKC